MSDHKENLTKRAETLGKELQEMSKQFELKKEEFLKVQGAIEMLTVLENEGTIESSDEEG
mgnify:FL=1|jgi:chaperonin cofactor prefoldin|tara:strand:- start:294 stop:473 length:180 start_codon:yes stop_codon:yes gene_type:complete